MITDEELTARLGRADRGRAVRALDPVELDAFAVGLSEVVHARKVRRRWGIGALLAASLAVPVMAAPALADGLRFLAQTGNYCTGSECPTLDGAPSEFIDPSASDIDEWVASQLPADYPLPPTITAEQVLAAVQTEVRAVDGSIAELHAATVFRRHAYCAWIGEWLAADTARDPLRRAEAADQLGRFPDDPVIVATDGGGVVSWLRTHAASALAGDRDGMQVAAWQHMCASWDGELRTAWVAENGPAW